MMNRSNYDFFRPFISFFLFFLIFTIVYSPVLYFEYLFHDDVFFWLKLEGFGFKHIFFDLMIAEGRHVGALLISLEGLFVHKVSDLGFLRFLAILIISITACLLFLHLRKYFSSNIKSFFIVIPIFFLPGFEDIVFYGGYFYFTLAILLACWSFIRIDTEKGFIIPIVSQVIAISIYPPCSMFFWTMIGMTLLFVQDRFDLAFNKKLWRMVGFGLISFLIYATVLFLQKSFFIHKISNSLYDPYLMNHDLIGKLVWFFREPMLNALNFWCIFPRIEIAFIVSGFIIFTFVIVLLKKILVGKSDKSKIVLAICHFGLFIFAFFLTFLPNLVATANVAFYRCLIPLTSLIWFVLIWSIFQWFEYVSTSLRKLITIGLLSVAVLWGGITTFKNVLFHRVLPSHLEWNAFKKMAESISFKSFKAILIIPPNHTVNERYDEFGVVTSQYVEDIFPLLFCLFQGVEKTSQQLLPLIYYVFPNTDRAVSVELFYYEKLSNDKWIFRSITKEDRFHDFDPSILDKTLDRGTYLKFDNPKDIQIDKSWYVLNLRDNQDFNNLIFISD